ncbi:unnamed protein product, partial [Ascophyllum nodosum]
GGATRVCNSSSYHKISRVHATLVEKIWRDNQDHVEANHRIAMSRAVSACLVVTTTASCTLLEWSGLTDLALGRLTVAIAGFIWFWSTFTEAFRRDTLRACNGISLLCFFC